MPNPSSTSTGNPQLNYQYNYNYGYGPDDPQHRQLHRIWETGPEGELLINRSNNLVPSSSDADAVQATGHVFLDVYLPNGLLLPIQCPLQRTLALLKQDVFIQARKYPLSNRILDISNYIFSTIGLDGAYVELYDEQKTVSSLQFLFLPFLILIEPVGNKTEKELNQNIGFVMGITLKELERSIGEELQHYRLKLFESCLEAQTQRGTQSFLHYAFPEEPLLHHEVSIQRNQHFGEVSEKDLEYQELSEKPEEVQRRAMEKLRQKMQFSDAYIEVWYGTKLSGAAASTTQADEQFKYSVRIRNVLEMKLDGVIAAALRELRLQHGLEIPQQPSDFILQIAGKRVFITRSDIFLTQFDYIRSCFENYRIPRLVIRKKKLVFSDYPPPPPIFEPSYVRREKHNQYLKSELSRGAENIVAISSSQQNTKQFWDLDENLRIRIHSVSNITVKDVTDRFFIRVAVAVGRHVLDVKESPTITPSNPRWAQETFIDFDVYMKDLPQCVQLCFSLISLHSSTNPVESAKSRKQRAAALSSSSQTTPSKADQVQPLGWANIHLFDWRNRLIQGKQTLSLQAFGKEEIRLAFAASGQEPLQFIHFENFVDSSAAAMARGPKLEIEMIEYFGNSTIIEYPSNAVIQRYIAWLKQQRRHRAGSREEDSEEEQDDNEQQQQQAYEECRQKGGQKSKQLPGPDLIRLFQLRRCLDSAQLTEDDQSFLWRVRYRIRRLFPQMLPVLADCALIWRDRETSSEFYHLLAEWPLLHVDTAIELLDGRYVDARLREMAVQHLDAALDDDQLQLYLLILVQAIRFEPHAYSPLIRMLLTRSLMDYRVGHTLFWLLRAELAHLQAINQPASSNTSSTTLSPLFTRFALLLEAYCRGNSAHLRSMIKQVEMISILTALSADIRACGNKETANKKLQQELLARKEQMQHMVSPVNATDRLGELIIEECRVLSSAKQPLLLTWRNPEILAELTAPTHQLIFKCGDDMRQDMLSLHVMRIMDAKWKCQLQQDFCMTLYEVLPMGKNIGLIHVVPECQTLFQIQCEAKRTASLNMDVALLNKYIYKKCCSSDSKKYLECVDRFTFSLAGYCVATYVLGIKDRHQDNIMLAKDGRIFHIDFGHFLGHTKRKLGINRERTDFILTDHFLYVISRGKSNVRQTYEYTSFREECIKGFLVLHNQARFFIALFRMMCCMGLPELNSPENVDFLRQSLMYEKVERGEARASFEQIFEDVVRGDWSVQLNWFFHSVRHM